MHMAEWVKYYTFPLNETNDCRNPNEQCMNNQSDIEIILCKVLKEMKNVKTFKGLEDINREQLKYQGEKLLLLFHDF